MRFLKAKNADGTNHEILSNNSSTPCVEIMFGASRGTDADAEETDTGNRSAVEDTDAEETDTEAIVQNDTTAKSVTAKSVVFSAVENGTVEGSALADTSAKGTDTAAVAQKDRIAILLLDFQNEFVEKGGKLHDDVAETMYTIGVIENVPRLVDLAR